MHPSSRPAPLWVTWLSVVSAGVMAFGLLLVVAPTLAARGFSLLIYGDAGHLASFGPEPARYVTLAHAVLGATMLGWGLALLLVTRRLLARGSKLGWRLIAFSVAAWFVLDTAYSLASGFWHNAVLNLAFVGLFAVPLLATYRDCDAADA